MREPDPKHWQKQGSPYLSPTKAKYLATEECITALKLVSEGRARARLGASYSRLSEALRGEPLGFWQVQMVSLLLTPDLSLEDMADRRFR